MRTLKTATLNFEVKKQGNIWSFWFPKISTQEITVYKKTNEMDDARVTGCNIFFRAVSPISGKELFLRFIYSKNQYCYRMEDQSIQYTIPRDQLYKAFGCMTASQAADYMCSKVFGGK